MRPKFFNTISIVVGLSLALVLSIGLVQAQDDGGRGNKGAPQPGNRLFSDDFATFVNRWETSETSTVTVAYEEQALHVELLADRAEVLTQPSTPFTIENFLLSTQVQFVDDSNPTSLAGIVFGYQNANNYYVFGVRASGHYEVRLKQDGVWQTTPLVRGYYPELDEEVGSAIELQILYDAGYFELSINGEILAPFFDNQLTAGEFGLYAETETATAHIVFDDYAVYDLVYGDVDSATPEVTETPDENATPEPTPEAETPSEDVELVKPPRI